MKLNKLLLLSPIILSLCSFTGAENSSVISTSTAQQDYSKVLESIPGEELAYFKKNKGFNVGLVSEIGFNEYDAKYYDLKIYAYNSTGYTISNTASNRIYVGLGIKEDGTYSKFVPIKYSIDSISDDNKLYKCSIDKTALYTIFSNVGYEYTTEATRTYYISSLEYTVNGVVERSANQMSWKYEGLAAGMDPKTQESTLQLSTASNEVINVENLYHNSNQLVKTNQGVDNFFSDDVLFYNYFQLPNYLLAKYGTVSAIKYLYEGYYTPDMIFVYKSMEDDYNRLHNFEPLYNVKTDYAQANARYTTYENKGEVRNYRYWEEMGKNGKIISHNFNVVDQYAVSGNRHNGHGRFAYNANETDPELKQNYVYSPYIAKKDYTDTTLMSSSELEQLVLKNNGTSNAFHSKYKNSAEFPNGQVIKEVIDSDFLQIGEKYDIGDNERAANWWTMNNIANDKVARYDLKPIVKVDELSIDSDQNLAYIKSSDKEQMRELINDDSTLYVLNYALGQMNYSPVYVTAPGRVQHTKVGWYYRSNYILNFNFIQFTFSKDNGETTIIPAVNKPYNEFPTFKKPQGETEPSVVEEEKGLLITILTIVGIAFVALLVLSIIFPSTIGKFTFALVKGIWNAITYPFKWIYGKLANK